MKKSVVCLGEALVDFIPETFDNVIYKKCMGGAPANVAAGLAVLGVNTSFIGKVGRDALGNFLVQTLQEKNVNTKLVIPTDEAKTGCVIVTLDENREREFDFINQPSADHFLHKNEIDEFFIEEHGILHIGSISLIHEAAKKATLRAVEYAEKHNLLRSFDPNVRLNLWPSPEKAREQIIETIAAVDIVKVSDDELTFLTGEEEIETGAKKLMQQGLKLLFVTMGKNGSWAFTKTDSIFVPSIEVIPMDSTGAGDAFMAAALSKIAKAEKEIEKMDAKEIEMIVKFANIAGALSTTVKGAIEGLHREKEIEQFLS